MSIFINILVYKYITSKWGGNIYPASYLTIVLLVLVFKQGQSVSLRARVLSVIVDGVE